MRRKSGPLNRIPVRLLALSQIMVIVLILLVTAEFAIWVINSLQNSYEQFDKDLNVIGNKIKRDIEGSPDQVRETFEYQKQGIAEKFVPLKVSEAPTVLSRGHDIDQHKTNPGVRTFVLDNNPAREIKIHAVYASSLRERGGGGAQYLTILAWFSDESFILDDPKQWRARNTGDYFTLAFQDLQASTRKLGYVLLVPQPITVRRDEDIPSGAIAQVQGFVVSSLAPNSIGQTTLILDPSVNGYILKKARNRYILGFRIAVKSPSIQRAVIDSEEGIGFAQFDRAERDQEPIRIGTFIGVRDEEIIPGARKVWRVEADKYKGILGQNKGLELRRIGPKDNVDSHTMLLADSQDEEDRGAFREMLDAALCWYASHLQGRITTDSGQIGIDKKLSGQGLDITANKYILRISGFAAQVTDDWLMAVGPLAYMYGSVVILLVLMDGLFLWYFVRNVRGLAMSLQMYMRDTRHSRKLFDHITLRSHDEIGFLARQIKRVLLTLQIRERRLQKTTDELARRRAQLDAQLHARNELNIIFRHEINSPVQALMGLLPEGSAGRFQIERVRRASKEILDAMTLEEAFSAEHELKVINLNEVVESIVIGRMDSGGGTNEKQVIVEFIPAGANISARADVEHLESVMDRVLDNARDYGKRIEVCVEDGNENAIIKIFNDGPHIPGAMIDTIFAYGISGRHGEKSCNSEESHHYGIGLFSAKMRLGVMDGTISASNVDGGVLFCITLPKPKQKPEARGAGDDFFPESRNQAAET